MYEIGSQDTVIELADAPPPDVGAPLPQLLVTEHWLLLAYLPSEPDPNWDGSYVNIISTGSGSWQTAGISFLLFTTLLSSASRRVSR